MAVVPSPVGTLRVQDVSEFRSAKVLRGVTEVRVREEGREVRKDVRESLCVSGVWAHRSSSGPQREGGLTGLRPRVDLYVDRDLRGVEGFGVGFRTVVTWRRPSFALSGSGWVPKCRGLHEVQTTRLIRLPMG